MKRLLDFLAKTFYVPIIRFGSLKWPTLQIPRMSLRLPSIAAYGATVPTGEHQFGRIAVAWVVYEGDHDRYNLHRYLHRCGAGVRC